MKNLYMIFFLIISGSLYAQPNLENANWIFGNVCRLDFNNNTLISPVAPPYGTSVTSLMPQPTYDTLEGCASISDEDGNLLFFTDGRRVYRVINNNIEIIDFNSGANLLQGNTSSSQNTIIIPRPNWEGRYYLVAIAGFSGIPPRGLYWSEFDINTNQFISINNVMGDGANTFNHAFLNKSESITSCVAANGVDMWIITHIENDSYSRVLSYLVTPNGITPAPSGTFIMPLPNISESYSLKVSPEIVSPDTRLLALGRRWSNPLVGTFNNATGTITINPTAVGNAVLGANSSTYSVEFSPNSQILYFSRFNTVNPPAGVFAVDLANPTVESLVVQGTNNSEICTLQRGLNDRLYAVRNFRNFILEITNPNSFGSWSTTNITLNNGQVSRLGLPQWIWPTCKNTLTLSSPTNDVSGINSRRERSEWIEASNKINASTTTNTIYHAGNYVELRVGFEARNGSRFAGYIQGCTNNTDFVYKDIASENGTGFIGVLEVTKSFIVSPNPSNSFIDLNIKNDTFNKISIITIDGRMVLDKTIETTNSYNLDISRYASGVYIVNVISGNGKTYSQKLIKN